jgi:hypothetical protein
VAAPHGEAMVIDRLDAAWFAAVQCLLRVFGISPR